MPSLDEKIDAVLRYMQLLEANYAVIDARIEKMAATQEWYLAVLAEMNPQFREYWDARENQLER